MISEYLLIVLIVNTWSFSSPELLEQKAIKNAGSHWHCRKIHFIVIC